MSAGGQDMPGGKTRAQWQQQADEIEADEIERLQSAMQYAGAELGKARERIAELEADLEVKTHRHKRDLAEYNRVATEVERLEGAVQHNLDCVHAREARIETLEAAIDDAMPCLDEHDPEVAAICRAVTEQEDRCPRCGRHLPDLNTGGE